MADPLSKVNLDSLIEELMDKAGAVKSGRATKAFRAFPGGSLTQVLLILKEGKELAEHENPGQALLHVVRGRAKLYAGDESIELGTNEHAVVPQQRHGLLALEDTAVLLTVVRSH